MQRSGSRQVQLSAYACTIGIAPAQSFRAKFATGLLPTAKMKRPAFMFYPADWQKDPGLSVCSLAARGLVIELICIAHQSDEYGYLTVNGIPMGATQIARIVGESPRVIVKLLAELAAAGVFSLDERGAIFSRRMIRDEHIRNIRANAGRLGGNPNLLDSKDKPKVKQNGKQKPTPSFAFAVSISNEVKAAAKHSADPDIEQTSAAAQSADTLTARTAELAELLRKRGASIYATDLHVRSWAETGVTDDQAIAALEIAQQRRADECSTQPIGSGYLNAFILDTTSPAWSSSPKLMEAKADEIGIDGSRPGETLTRFRDRISNKLREAAT